MKKKSKYKRLIRITQEDHDWIRLNRGKKSMAGLLESILRYYKIMEGK